ncbi:MAG TPA: hypothetical protein VF240_20950 [Pyrinomonadaceae bacterium]
MDLGSYRSEYAAYCSALQRERHEHHAGRAPEPHLAPLRDRYADLWTRETIDELRRKLDDTPAHFETERAGLRALVHAACLNHAEASADEVAAELARCEAAACVEWGGEKIGAAETVELIAREADATRRRELAARWFDALRPCDDLRAARLYALAECVRALGFDGPRSLYEDASGVSLHGLASAADSFLERTAPTYMSHLARSTARENAFAAVGSLSHADELFFGRAKRLDALLTPRGERAAYAELMAGLGVRVEQQKNLIVEDGERGASTACFGVRPPDEVYLVAAGDAHAAWKSYSDFFFEAGRAQHFAWSSPETAARRPEFIHAADAAARTAAGFLFKSLFYDATWGVECLRLRPVEARELARSAALLELLDTRRDCAALRYALAVDEAGGVLSEQLAEAYLSLYGEATGFARDPATRLLDTAGALDAAGRLRARLLAASLREHLRSRYGHRWYASRAAGGELTDIWNTALLHPAEQLARLAWGGTLEFDLLTEELKATMEGD